MIYDTFLTEANLEKYFDNFFINTDLISSAKNQLKCVLLVIAFSLLQLPLAKIE